MLLYIALGWLVLATPVAVLIGRSVKRADDEATIEKFREELSALG